MKARLQPRAVPVCQRCFSAAPQARSTWRRTAGLLGALWLAVDLATAQPLRLAVSRTPLSLPQYVVQENGYFAAEAWISSCLTVLAGTAACARCLTARPMLR